MLFLCSLLQNCAFFHWVHHTQLPVYAAAEKQTKNKKTLGCCRNVEKLKIHGFANCCHLYRFENKMIIIHMLGAVFCHNSYNNINNKTEKQNHRNKIHRLNCCHCIR